MKLHLRPLSLALAMLACTTFFGAAGCSSPRERAREEAHMSGMELRNAIAAARPQLDESTSALLNVVANADTSPKASFEHFTDELRKLEYTSDQLRKEVARAQQQGNAYFDAWSREVMHGGQRSSAADMAAAQQRYSQLLQYMDNTRGYMRQYVLDLKQIESSLKGNLTPKNIRAQESVISDVVRRKIDVQQSTDVLLAAMDNVLKPSGASR